MGTKLIILIVLAVIGLLIAYRIFKNKDDSDIWGTNDSLWTKLKKCCQKITK